MRGSALMERTEQDEIMRAFGDDASKGALAVQDSSFSPVGQGVEIHDGIITARRVEVARDEARILQRIAARAAVAGTDWFYRFPVKKKSGGQDWITGPSIKCANNVARLYGNCQVDTRVVDAGPSWIIYARFVDYETGFSYTRPFQQNKGASRMGGTGPEAEARRLDIALQIGVSKAIRNVVCNALETFTDYAFDEAQKNLVGRVGKELDKYKGRVKARLEELQVDIKRVELALGRSFEKWLAPEVAQVIAELQAVQDGMASIDETWAPLPPTRGEFKDDPPHNPETGEVEKEEPTSAAAAASSAATEGQAGGDSKPEVTGQPTTTNPWAIPESVVGQEPRRQHILTRLLPEARVKADVDAIETQHEEFLSKLGRLKAETLRKIEERRIELPEHLEPEE